MRYESGGSSGYGAGLKGSSGTGGISSDSSATGRDCSDMLRGGNRGCVANSVVSGKVVVEGVFLGLLCSSAKSLAMLPLELLGVLHPYISASRFPLLVLLALCDVAERVSCPGLLGVTFVDPAETESRRGSFDLSLSFSFSFSLSA